MPEDVEEEAGHAEETASGDVDEILLLVGLSTGIIFVLALIFDYKQLAELGVGLIGSFTSPVTATGNGAGNLITAFFDGLSKRVTNMGLWILPSRNLMVLYANIIEPGKALLTVVFIKPLASIPAVI